MMGEQFRLRLFGLREALLQHLGDLLVILLAFALEQRLIGGVLNQRVLEEIRRLRRQPTLIDQLRPPLIASAPAVSVLSSERRDGVQQFIARTLARWSRRVAQSLSTVAKPIQPGHQRVLNVEGIASGGQRHAVSS